MTIEHLLFTPQQDPTNHHPTTMVMLVDGDAYEKSQKGSSGEFGPAANIVDSFDVFKYASGQHGELVRPNKSEISSVFGTTNVDEIANFMLKNGHLHGGKGKKKGHFDDETEADPHSRMHVPRSGRPL